MPNGNNDACRDPLDLSSYTSAYPMATYEAGEIYCLAWPMKNHGNEGIICSMNFA